MAEFEVHFHGVRGSMASPGVDTSRVGGNTSCVEVRFRDQSIVLDAGTGLRTVGDRLVTRGPQSTAILLSHLHWDHIQGLPFFKPLYVPGNQIKVVSGPNGVMPLEQALRRQMSAPFFPVNLDDVGADLQFEELRPQAQFELGDVVVTMARLNHPDPVYGFRLEAGGRVVVYATDTEHYSCVDPNLAYLARGADLLIYDAQYTPEEYSGATGFSKVGWGHSTYRAAAALASTAGVGELVLFHHDPGRSDEQVGEIEAAARVLFPRTIAAREGMQLSTGSGQDHASAA